MSPNKDKTGNERQQRRRKREKEWLKDHGFESWEALHTALMNGETSLTKHAPDGAYLCGKCGLMSRTTKCENCGHIYKRPAGKA